MKKLKLEELEVKSLTTSLQDQSADEVKGGTVPTTALCIGTLVSVLVVTAVFSTPAY